MRLAAHPGRCSMTERQMQDARHIQDGACNPRAIARALVRSIDADYQFGWKDGPDKCSPATRQIVHQLLWIVDRSDAYTDDGPFEGKTWLSDHDDCLEIAGSCCEGEVKEIGSQHSEDCPLWAGGA